MDSDDDTDANEIFYLPMMPTDTPNSGSEDNDDSDDERRRMKRLGSQQESNMALDG